MGRAPWSASSSPPLGSADHAARSSSLGATNPRRKGWGSRPSSPGSTACSTLVSVFTAFSAAPPYIPECRSRSPVLQRDVEVAEPARGDVERRPVALDHPAVEDHAGVGAALVRGEVVDDRMAAGLLLAVAGEAHVHRQLAGQRQPRRRPRAGGRAGPCRRPPRARRPARCGRSPRRAASPRARADRAAARRNARST